MSILVIHLEEGLVQASFLRGSGEVTKVYTVDFDTYDNPTPTTTEDSSGGLLEAAIMCTDVFPLPPDSDIDRVLKEYEKRNSK